MKKNLLFLTASLLLAGTTYAYDGRTQANDRKQTLKTVQTRNVPTTIPWGYCAESIDRPIGNYTSSLLSCAIYVPNSGYFKLYNGKQIRVINIGLDADVTKFSIFITKDLNEKPFYEQQIGKGTEGWNIIELDKPYDIKEGEDFYIGYTCEGILQLGFSGKSNPNSAWVKEDGIWTNYFDKDWGSACIQAEISGDPLPQNEISLEELHPAYGKAGQTFQLQGKVKNNTLTPINNFEVSFQIGENTYTQTIESNISPLGNAPFWVKDIPAQELGKYEVQFTITKVNGETDPYMENNSTESTAEMFEYYFPKKVLVEEGTGAGCVWCPRSIVGMEMMQEKYPDTFIGIAVHNAYNGLDKLTVTSYAEALNRVFMNYYPNSMVSRKPELTGDPYYDLENNFLTELAAFTKAGITAKAEYCLNDSSVLAVSSEITFVEDDDKANYRVAYVLLENEIPGIQGNAYAGGNYGEMGGFESKPAKADVIYQDVARGIYSSFNGIENSIPSTVVKGQPIENNYFIYTPNNIRNFKNLEVVAMLIDAKSGEIINADKVSHLEMGTISNIEQTNIDGLCTMPYVVNGELNVEFEADGPTTVSLYTAEGKQIALSTVESKGKETVKFPVTQLKGVYIIRVNNGNKVSVNKVVL